MGHIKNDAHRNNLQIRIALVRHIEPNLCYNVTQNKGVIDGTKKSRRTSRLRPHLHT